jgi:beta-galactosidase beta subunit
MSYMTKIDKSITSKLHFIIKNCITNKIDTNTIIQKLRNVFLNVQQMVTQLAT